MCVGNQQLLRQAKTRLGIDDPVDAQPADSIIISMIGHLSLTNLAPDSIKVLEVIKNSGILIRKGNSEAGAAASDLVVMRIGGSSIARFFFPRQKTSPAGSKEWIFRFKMGLTMVEAKLDLTEMVWGGALAL